MLTIYLPNRSSILVSAAFAAFACSSSRAVRSTSSPIRSVRASSAPSRSFAAPAQRSAAAVCARIVTITASGTRRSIAQRSIVPIGASFVYAVSSTGPILSKDPI